MELSSQKMNIIFDSSIANKFDSIFRDLMMSNYTDDLTGCLLNCSQSGSCVLNSNKKYVCACKNDYTGSACEFSTNPCISKYPCRNNSTCLFNQTDYYCVCDLNYYYGKNCEYKIDICANETCSNNGVCNNIDSKANCSCFKYYYGNKCESISNELVIIKAVISVSSILAIIIIVLFYLLFVIIDWMTYFRNKTQKSPAYKYEITHEIRLHYYY